MFTNPVKNLKIFGLREDMIVADLGAGSGFYSIPIAKMVPRGKVYAIEIQKDFLITLRNKAKDNNLENIDCILGDIEKIGGTKLKNGIVDAVIVSNVFSQVVNKEKFIEEIKRILKENGKLLLIDWVDNSFVFKSYINKNISKDKTIEMFKERGFIVQKEIDAGEHHYGIIFTSK